MLLPCVLASLVIMVDASTRVDSCCKGFVGGLVVKGRCRCMYGYGRFSIDVDKASRELCYFGRLCELSDEKSFWRELILHS